MAVPAVALKDAVDLLNSSFTVHCSTEDKNQYRKQFIKIVQRTRRAVGTEMLRLVGVMQSNGHLAPDFYTRLVALERRTREAAPCPACKKGHGNVVKRPGRFFYKGSRVRVSEEVTVCSTCGAEYYTVFQRQLLEERTHAAWQHAHTS